MEKRRYGKTDEMLSIVGFGGILVTDETTSEASRLVSKAIDRGINYFDVAPSYGNAEEMLGPALEPYRNSVFLACKTGERKADAAQRELENSLKLLRTDHFDLYQFHAVTTSDDVEQIFGPGGAMETFVKAREQGLVRYLGFSAHSEEAAAALMERFDFDSILFPVNWVNWYQGEFGSKTLETAQEKGLAILALKTMAKRKWKEGERPEGSKTWYKPVDSYDEAKVGVRFTFSLPVTAGPSPGHEYLFDWMCDAAEEFTPLAEEEWQPIGAQGRELAPIFSNFESRWA